MYSTGEDRSRLRTGSAPQILATLRNLALTLIHCSGSSAVFVFYGDHGYDFWFSSFGESV